MYLITSNAYLGLVRVNDKGLICTAATACTILPCNQVAGPWSSSLAEGKTTGLLSLQSLLNRHLHVRPLMTGSWKHERRVISRALFQYKGHLFRYKDYIDEVVVREARKDSEEFLSHTCTCILRK